MALSQSNDLRDYLQALADQLSYADAAEALGFSRRSFNSVKEYYSVYEVIAPERTNQYPATPDEAFEPTPPMRALKLSHAIRRELKVETLVNLTDIHFPYQDDRALSVALALIEDIQPDIITLGGDIADFYALSKYSKDPKRATMLQEELDQVAEFLAILRRLAPDARIIYIEGNHEFRLRSYLTDKAPTLHGLRALQLESLLKLEELGIEYIQSRARTAYFKFGPIKVGHFDRVNQNSAYTAKLLVDKYRCSLVQGHVHRLGAHYRTDPDGVVVVGVEGGCLCQIDPEYTEAPNWQHGLTVVVKRVGEDRFHLVQVPIVGYEAMYNNTLYSA